MAIADKVPVGQVLLLTRPYVVSTLFLPTLQIKRIIIHLPTTLYNLNRERRRKINYKKTV